MNVRHSLWNKQFVALALVPTLLVLIACAPSQAPAPSPTPAPMPVPTPTPSPTPAPTLQNVTINLTAQNMAFDKSEITVPAGAAVTIVFNNKDSGVPHNFAAYESSKAQTVIFKGEIITGPKTIEYKFTAPTTLGAYFFRCDVHPVTMIGKFVVKTS